MKPQVLYDLVALPIPQYIANPIRLTRPMNRLMTKPTNLDQPGHPPSLIRVFTVRMKKAWVLRYPLSAQRRLWSAWADAQDDLSLRWAQMPFCWFVTMRLMCVPFKSYLMKNINTVSIFTTDHCSVESTYLSYPSMSSEDLKDSARTDT